MRFLLAPTGRQSTDGGKQRVAPGRGQLKPPPPCADGARAGAGGGWRHVAGGYASLTPVCTLSPFQGLTLATLTDSTIGDELVESRSGTTVKLVPNRVKIHRQCFPGSVRSAVDLSRTEQAALPLRLCGKNTLAVLRRSRYAVLSLFFLFYLKNAKMKIFLSPRVFHPFTLLLAPFSKTCQFQIKPLSSIIYLKNSPKLTPLPRLPRSKKVRCGPL